MSFSFKKHKKWSRLNAKVWSFLPCQSLTCRLLSSYLLLFGASITVQANTLEPNIATFGSSLTATKQRLIGKCEQLTTRTIAKRLRVAEKSQRLLECTGYSYFGDKRTVELVFSDDQLDILRILNIRDVLTDLQLMLEASYGEPTISSQWLDYFSNAGISLSVLPDEMSFVSDRAKGEYKEFINETKDAQLNLSLTREQWLHDLDTLDSYILNNHINPFWHNEEAGYVALFYQARDYVSNTQEVDSNIVNGYIERLVAYIADGHSYVLGKTERYGTYPYLVEWFGDDLFIVRTDKEHKHLLGAQIVAFDDINVKTAANLIQPFLPAINSSSVKGGSRYVYRYGGLLYAAGISKASDKITLKLKMPNGKQVEENFNKDIRNYADIEFVYLGEGADAAKPIYRQKPGKKQWLKFLEKDNALYVHFGLVIEDNDGDIASLSRQIMRFLDAHKVGKLIIDIRNNRGGNSYLNAPLINAIANNQQINQLGNLFILTNRRTFSAAINFAGNMEVKTRALFVGEKVGDSATFAGESGPQAKFRLPNSRIVVSLSFSEWNTTYDNDRRDAISLDIPVELSVKDLLAGRDPVLQAALDYKATPRKTLALNKTQRQRWLGRYDFSADKALRITDHNGQLKMEITELAFSNLYPLSENDMLTDMSGVRLRRMANGSIELFQQGSENRELVQLDDGLLKPLELLVAGHFEQAKVAYLKIYNQNPELLSVRGNSLGILASHLKARHSSQVLYDQLREIALALHGYPIASWDASDKEP